MNAGPAARRHLISGRARKSLVVLAAAGALLTAGCAAGQDAQTAYEKPTLDGTEATIGKIALRGLSIDAPATATGYPKGASALVTVSISNSGSTPDKLIGITSTAFTSWTAFPKAADALQAQRLDGRPGAAGLAGSLPAGTRSVTVTPGGRVGFGLPDSTGGLLVRGLTAHTYPGNDITVTFTFAKAGAVKVVVPIALTTVAPSASISAPASEDIGD